MAKPKKNGAEIRIVVLQRGWVVVGKFSQDGDQCQLEAAKVVRRWGTTKGLGELATSGPLTNTVLDPAPTVRFHALTVIATIDCDQAKWASVCA
jgi:hypothetical protein